ncbi:MAG: DUF4129 domain-containing protein [Vicinamibacteria bacterium]|nr:DUF4129 domain-containing protein [Vicinamibacteria bacterium]
MSREAAPLTLVEYAERLEAIGHALRLNDLTLARERASELGKLRIVWEHGPLSPDAGLLEEVRNVTDANMARLAGRIARLVADLRDHMLSQQSAPARRDILENVKPKDELTEGCVVDPRIPRPSPGLRARFEKLLQDMADGLSTALRRIWDWLRRFWPSKPVPHEGAGNQTTTMVIAIGVVALAVLVLVILTLRAPYRKATELPAEATAPRSRTDDDPLSREADEWERYAESLAAAGRRREAIRAWYHAALVTLFRTGRLHYAKGRTNWEYVSALAPGLAWRATFIDLTRLFDREWYGHEDSSPQTLSACARQVRAVLRATRAAGANP